MNNAPFLFFKDGLWQKRCAVCPKFMVHIYKSQLKSRTCSHSCQLKGNKFRNGHIPTNAFTAKAVTGERNFNWKGDEVGYFAVHDWIIRHFGQPNFCESCGTEKSKAFNWSNVSKKYKRDREDWLRLCRKCHHSFDDISNKGWIKRKLTGEPVFPFRKVV